LSNLPTLASKSRQVIDIPLCMIKTTVQVRFDYLVSQVLWPVFKVRGYRKTGNNFRHYDPLGWGKIVNVQKSAYGDRDNTSFTLNTGLYIVEADRIWTGRPANERFLEPDCLIRARIGRLNGSGHDLWYELTEQTVPQALYEQVAQDVKAYVLPYLDRVDSLHTIIQQLLQQRRPNSAQAISTVFACGYQTEARQWLAQELATTTSRVHREQLESIKASLN
jgi:hypothetical protein